MEITFASECFELLADPALYWPRRRCVIVADTHLGKDALFQSRGIPVPGGVTPHDLKRLAKLLDEKNAKELLILGDLFHGPESNGAEMTAALHEFRRERPGVTITLIRGNHDLHAGDPDATLEIDVLNSLTVDDCKFLHHPVDQNSVDQTIPDHPAVIAGHIHPAARVQDASGSVNLPCFVIDERQMILPAFGRFTGRCVIDPMPGRRLMIASRGRVIELNSSFANPRVKI